MLAIVLFLGGLVVFFANAESGSRIIMAVGIDIMLYDGVKFLPLLRKYGNFIDAALLKALSSSRPREASRSGRRAGVVAIGLRVARPAKEICARVDKPEMSIKRRPRA